MYTAAGLAPRFTLFNQLRSLCVGPPARYCHAMASATTEDAVAVSASEAKPVTSPRNKNVRGYGDGPKPLPKELQQEVQDIDPTELPKRVVALHIGYVGTSYRGAWGGDL